MKQSLLATALAVVLGGLSINAMAATKKLDDHAKILVSTTILGSTCNIQLQGPSGVHGTSTGANPMTMQIDLPDIPTTDFNKTPAYESVQDTADFSVSFGSCDLGKTGATAELYFPPQTTPYDVTSDGYFKNEATGGDAATNVYLQLSSGGVVINAKNHNADTAGYSLTLTPVTGDANHYTLDQDFTIQLYKPAGVSVTKGTFNTTINMAIAYP